NKYIHFSTLNMVNYCYRFCKYEKEVNMKNIQAILITAGIMAGNFIPVFCIEESEIPQKMSKPQIAAVTETENKFDYINLDWWKNFNDPFLCEYIEKAVNYNHDLKIATISTKEYYDAVKVQFAQQLPSASAGLSPAYVKSLNTTSSGFQYALPVTANYEIDLFLKNRDKTKSVRKNYEMALLDERAAYIAVAAAVGSTYFNIVKFDKEIEIQKQIVNERKTIFDLMSKRNAHGITSTADTIRADKDYVASLSELSELEKQRDSLLHSLCVLIGDSSDNKEEIVRKSYDEIEYTGNIPESINSEIIQQRPDYLKSVHNIEKAGIDVRIAKKEFLPSFSIGGLALFNAADLGKVFNTTGMFNALGALAGIDFFQGGKKIANLRLRKHTYERLLEEYQQTNLTAIQEINDALLYVKKDNEKLLNTLQQEDFEKKDYGFYLTRYENGIVSKLDLSQSKENLLTINKLAVNQQVECFIDYIGLYKAAGSIL
ncbi:MAG: TolC family protein, partial [Candidatus Gastranaerophilales bacterium]|nr:TolC family protein [Candidatus Gastranaerophilales bacterium]